ncbi:MAG: type II CAAX endopeptidase family protein [Pseudomonadota bacterium]
MPSLGSGILVAAIYVALVGLGTALFQSFTAEPASMGGALGQLLPVQFLGVLFCLYVLIRFTGWAPAGFGRVNWGGMLWFAPAWAVLIFMAWDITQALTPALLQGFGAFGFSMLVLVTLCIAFGEEVVFRGVLLRGALTRLAVPVAMLLSAVAFGGLHTVNALLGQDAGDTSLQVIFALLVGFFLAPLALRIGNLWPLIIWHWLWNIAVILGQVTGILHPYVLIGIAVQTIIAIWLWAQFARQKGAT